MNFKEAKEYYKRLAIRHSTSIERIYKNEIDDCVSETEIFRDNSLFREKTKDLKNTPKNKKVCKVFDANPIETLFTFQKDALLTFPPGLLKKDFKIAILNDGSYKDPKRFLKGTFRTENILCYNSFLYNVLKTQNEYYNYNKENINDCFYSNSALYTPNIRFWKKDIEDPITKETPTIVADVITCSSPNINAAHKYYNHFKYGSANELTLEERIEFIINICKLKKIDILITNAYGCDLHGNPPRTVAGCFINAVSHSNLSGIYFAIPKIYYRNPHTCFTYECNETHIWEGE